MTTYYIDPRDGSNDNDGTSVGSAFADFAPINWDGRTPVQPGDTVRVRGTAPVTEHLNLYEVGDSSDQTIVYEPYQDESPVIDVQQNFEHCIKLNGAQNIVIRGFEIRNALKDGSILYGDTSADRDLTGVRLEDVTSHDNGQGGNYGSGFRISHAKAHANLHLNCLSYDNRAGSDSDGFEIVRDAYNNRFVDCVSINDPDGGYDTFSASDKGQEFIRCVAAHSGIVSDGTTGNAADEGNGVGFKLGGGGTTGGGNYLERCIAYKCKEPSSNPGGARGSGYSDNQSSAPSEFYNCIAYDNDDVGFNGPNQPHILRNCIAYQNGTTVSLADDVDDTYNTWNLGIDDPQFSSVDESTTDFLRLASGSPCIDAGVNVGMEYNGDAPDLGAYEYQEPDQETATLQYYDGSNWNPVETTVLYRST